MGYRHPALCVFWVSPHWEEVQQAQELGAQSSEFTTVSTLAILYNGHSLLGFPGTQSHFCQSEMEPWRKPLVWGKPLVYSYTGNQDCLPRIKLLKTLIPLLTCLLQETVYVWDICKSLTIVSHYILYFYWGRRLFSCLLESAWSQTPGRKEESH